MRTPALLAAAAVAVPTLVISPSVQAKTCQPFLAAASPYAAVRGQAHAGTVTLFTPSGHTTLSQADVGQVPELNDAFGAALARGDFNGDGCADLAIGASEEFLGASIPDADGNGVVTILYGSAKGLRFGGTLDITHTGRKAGTDRFGATLASGDIDGDGDDELVVGAPGADGGGAIGIFGLGKAKPSGNGILITQDTPWVGQEPGPTDQFGAAIAVGDFDGDGRGEIAVGAPGDGGLRSGAGQVTILNLKTKYAGPYTQESPNVRGLGEKWDAFGSALAAGDFNGDGRDDLAIGVPGEDLSMLVRGMDYGDGAVNVIYGTKRGLSAIGSEIWTQDTPGIKGVARYSDRFGSALAAGDLNGDGDDELVIGVPGESAVQILAGTKTGGLTRNHNMLLTGPPGSDFGASVAVERQGLVIAAPGVGRLTLYRTQVHIGSYTGVIPESATTLATGSADSLYGYALS